MLYYLSKVFSNPLLNSGYVYNESAEKMERTMGDIWSNNRKNGVQVSSINYICIISRVLPWFMTKRNKPTISREQFCLTNTITISHVCTSVFVRPCTMLSTPISFLTPNFFLTFHIIFFFIHLIYLTSSSFLTFTLVCL